MGWLALLAGLPLAAAADGPSVVFGVVLDAGDAAVAGSERTAKALEKELERRGFDAAAAAAPVAGTTAERLDALRGAGSELVVLVETEAGFYAQVAGRYRWTVTAHVTVAARGDDEPLARDVEVPVFLVYDHEREAEALAEASTMLARKVGAVARAYAQGER